MRKLFLSLAMVSIGALTYAQEQSLDAIEQEVVTPVQQGEDVVIEGNDLEESVSLNGEALVVKGNNVIVHAAGNASKVTVEGNDCQVVVDSTQKIEIKGSNSYVYYREGEPEASVSDGSAVQKID
ncbi:MAG: DUF3060 domain-containing protein [Weeksellaceae bacterium]